MARIGVSAVLIGAYSGFAPQLLSAGQVGEAAYMLGGFVLLGLAFGQSSGVVNASFSTHYRYTGAAIVSNSAWFIGAGFAPLVALGFSSRFGLVAVGVYLFSGAACTLAAPLRRSALKVVMPAHISGAASAGSSDSGMRATAPTRATIYSW